MKTVFMRDDPSLEVNLPFSFSRVLIQRPLQLLTVVSPDLMKLVVFHGG